MRLEVDPAGLAIALALVAMSMLLVCLLFEFVLVAWLSALLATWAFSRIPDAKRYVKWGYLPVAVLFLLLNVGVTECPHQRVVTFARLELTIEQRLGRGACGNAQYAWNPIVPWERVIRLENQ